MSLDNEEFERYLELLADIYEPEELVMELGLTVWDIIEAFRDRLEEKPLDLDKYRKE